MRNSILRLLVVFMTASISASAQTAIPVLKVHTASAAKDTVKAKVVIRKPTAPKAKGAAVAPTASTTAKADTASKKVAKAATAKSAAGKSTAAKAPAKQKWHARTKSDFSFLQVLESGNYSPEQMNDSIDNLPNSKVVYVLGENMLYENAKNAHLPDGSYVFNHVDSTFFHNPKEIRIFLRKTLRPGAKIDAKVTCASLDPVGGALTKINRNARPGEHSIDGDWNDIPARFIVSPMPDVPPVPMMAGTCGPMFKSAYFSDADTVKFISKDEPQGPSDKNEQKQEQQKDEKGKSGNDAGSNNVGGNSTIDIDPSHYMVMDDKSKAKESDEDNTSKGSGGRVRNKTKIVTNNNNYYGSSIPFEVYSTARPMTQVGFQWGIYDPGQPTYCYGGSTYFRSNGVWYWGITWDIISFHSDWFYGNSFDYCNACAHHHPNSFACGGNYYDANAGFSAAGHYYGPRNTVGENVSGRESAQYNAGNTTSKNVEAPRQQNSLPQSSSMSTVVVSPSRPVVSSQPVHLQMTNTSSQEPRPNTVLASAAMQQGNNGSRPVPSSEPVHLQMTTTQNNSVSASASTMPRPQQSAPSYSSPVMQQHQVQQVSAPAPRPTVQSVGHSMSMSSGQRRN